MDIQLSNFIVFLPMVIMIFVTLNFAVTNRVLKRKIIPRFYKDASFYPAHQLLQHYHQTLNNGASVDELTALNQEITEYFNQPHQLSQGVQGHTLSTRQYRQYVEAQRIMKKHINFINADMSDKQRILVATQIKIDCLNYADSYAESYTENRAESYAKASENTEQENTDQSAMVSSIAKMP